MIKEPGPGNLGIKIEYKFNVIPWSIISNSIEGQVSFGF